MMAPRKSILFPSVISLFDVAPVPAYLVNLLTHLMWDVAGLETSSLRLPHLMAELMTGPLRPFLDQKHVTELVMCVT